LMILPTSHRGLHILYLPVPLISLFLFCIAVVWILSAIAVVVPDVLYVVNIMLLLLMFVSPVGYSVDMVPGRARLLLYLNPMSYLMDEFRFALLGIRTNPMWVDAAFLVASVGGAMVAGTFFRRMSPVFSDYE
jgi:lipopolysaccharide transport system permease protein